MKNNEGGSLKNQYEQTSQKIAKLESGYEHLESSLKNFKYEVIDRFHGVEAAIQRLTDTIQKRSQVSWPLIVSLIMAFLALCGFFYAGLTNPLLDKISYQNEVIIDLKKEYNEHKSTHGHPKLSKDLAEYVAKTDTKFTEIETQFMGKSQIENIREMHHRELMSMLWKKCFPDIDLPPVNYYPATGDYGRNF